MFVVTFLPFSFCALAFPRFHLFFCLMLVSMVWSSQGCFRILLLPISLGNVFSLWYLEFGNVCYSRLRFCSLIDDPKRTNRSH